MIDEPSIMHNSIRYTHVRAPAFPFSPMGLCFLSQHPHYKLSSLSLLAFFSLLGFCFLVCFLVTNPTHFLPHL